MKKIILAFFLVSIVSYLGYVGYLSYLRKPTPLLSPKASSTAVSTKRIIGFLPYWQLANIEALHLTMLDEVVYFGLHGTKEGEIATRDSDGNKDQGYARLAAAIKELRDATKATNTTISVAIILQDNGAIEEFLKSKTAQTKLIGATKNLIDEYALSAINLDFEYAGIPAKETVTGYTDFVANFVNELKTHYPSLIVGVDVTADAIRKSRLYDVGQLATVADHIVLMGYDFYRPASDVAGPVAPLLGKELYEYDVTTAVADFLAVVPREKLVLGVPYYGWDFPTINEERGSFVEKRPDETVALSSYKRNKRLIDEEHPAIHFDEESQTPWMSYRDPDTNGVRQVWFENEVSLGKKYDLVNKENLAGIAIWALGYDGNSPELTKLLKEKFGR